MLTDFPPFRKIVGFYYSRRRVLSKKNRPAYAYVDTYPIRPAYAYVNTYTIRPAYAYVDYTIRLTYAYVDTCTQLDRHMRMLIRTQL